MRCRRRWLRSEAGEPLPETPANEHLEEWGRGSAVCPLSRTKARIAHTLGTTGFTPKLSRKAETSGPVCIDPPELPDCQRAIARLKGGVTTGKAKPSRFREKAA